MDQILVLDFGSQTAQLIARRIRDIGVYSHIVPGNIPFDEIDLSEVRGLIFSGSPFSVYEPSAPTLDPEFLNTGLPTLGICYGLQRVTHDGGGKVEKKTNREFGRSRIHYRSTHPLFDSIPENFVSWMSHGDSLDTLAPGYTLIAESENGHPAAVGCKEKNFVGIQFHPEVTHCEFGTQILTNFALKMCGARNTWNMNTYLENETEEIRRVAGNRPVLLLISGGVDSTVVGGLLLKSLPPHQVHLMYIDTGMMRKGESAQVALTLEAFGAENLYLINASSDFLPPLKGVTDPEEKRRIIGDTFIRVQEREVNNRNIRDSLLAQGTLYTDLIESGKGVGKSAHVIKSHHNVRSPLVEEKRARGDIIEPLGKLYKDEVRRLGLTLGIDPKVVGRHPFPGPGLGVRILGEVTPEKCDILREADALFIDELRARGLYDKIWQAFCVLLPVRSVGVAGDTREYGSVVALRAIVSSDGMTADVYPFEMKDLLNISSKITNMIPSVGRVTYDISSKPPATIEWE